MFRIVFLCMILFPSTLHAENSWEGALDALLGAPWAKSPSSLPDSAAWTVAISGTQEEQGYNLRAFVKNDGPVRTKIFTYAEPSLSSFREIILMGYVQATVQTEEEARGFHRKMITSLQNRGFESMPPDTTRLAVMLRTMYKGSELFRKGKMDGRVYYIQDYRTEKWFIRTSISHARFQEFKNKRMAEWPKWWDFQYMMPEKLVQELESKNVSRMLSPALWDSIKHLYSLNRDSLWRGENIFPVDKLVSAYETIDQRSFTVGDRPAALLFKNYLARYLFLNGWSRGMTTEQKKWLDTHGLTNNYSNLGGDYIYGETNLWNLLAGYPDSYWGQFAFLELLIRGFDTSGTCRNGNDQWRAVLEKGPAFLEKYPDSEFTPDIRFCIGTAAETLYNLGIMEDHPERESSGESRNQYAEQSQYARKQAIKYYEETLQSPQKDKFENHLKYILPRLRAGFGTGCHYYYCFYD